MSAPDCPDPRAPSDGSDRPAPEPDDLADFGFAPDERDVREAAGDAPQPAAGAAHPSAPGGGAPAGRSAAGEHPPADDVRPPTPAIDPAIVAVARASGNRWWAAIAALVLIVVAGSLLTLYNGRSGSPAIGPGDELPPFAAPLATAPKLEHDAVNYAATANQGDAGRVPACSVDDPSVVTSCALLDRGPLVLMMFASGVEACVTAVDDLDRLRGGFPRIQTLVVEIGGQHDKTARTVRDRRWSLPVAYDRDGGLSARLGAPSCPFVLFVAADGTVRQRLFGTVTRDDLERGISALARDAATADGTASPARTSSATGR